MTAVLSPADWLSLFAHFMLLSLLAVGGAIVVAPEMHRVMVGQTGLLSDVQFNSSIAIAQAAPGPNVLFVAVLGYQAAGLAGAMVTLTGMMLPSSALALAISRWGRARHDWRAIRAFKAGLAPITIALLFATSWILTMPATGWPGWPRIALTAAAAALAWRTRIHLLILIAAGALAGLAGWV